MKRAEESITRMWKNMKQWKGLLSKQEVHVVECSQGGIVCPPICRYSIRVRRLFVCMFACMPLCIYVYMYVRLSDE